jgi:hypothetical protein
MPLRWLGGPGTRTVKCPDAAGPADAFDPGAGSRMSDSGKGGLRTIEQTAVVLPREATALSPCEHPRARPDPGGRKALNG